MAIFVQNVCFGENVEREDLSPKKNNPFTHIYMQIAEESPPSPLAAVHRCPNLWTAALHTAPTTAGATRLHALKALAR